MLLKEDKDVLTYSEFLAAAADHSALVSQENMRIIFQIVDVDNVGSIFIDQICNEFGRGKKTVKFRKLFLSLLLKYENESSI